MHQDTCEEISAADRLAALGQALERLHSLVASMVAQRTATDLHAGDMSFSQLTAMFRLYRAGPQTIADLAEGADLTPTAASRMVERLVQGGLVERREDALDRRQRRVDLTEAGRTRLRGILSSTAMAYADVLAGAPPAVLDRLSGVLADLQPYLPRRG